MIMNSIIEIRCSASALVGGASGAQRAGQLADVGQAGQGIDLLARGYCAVGAEHQAGPGKEELRRLLWCREEDAFAAAADAHPPAAELRGEHDLVTGRHAEFY